MMTATSYIRSRPNNGINDGAGCGFVLGGINVALGTKADAFNHCADLLPLGEGGKNDIRDLI